MELPCCILPTWFGPHGARRRARFDDREARGMTLLREWLSPQQLWQLEAYNYFEVTGCDSGTR